MRRVIALFGVLTMLGATSVRSVALEPPAVVVAVGDMACSPSASRSANVCQELAVSGAMLAVRPDALLALGDLQYESGAAWGPYEASYGRLLSITRPVPGNHEYLTDSAAGYFGYFGTRAGPKGLGYYSFDVGAWHLVALNSECQEVGGCGERSPQTTWLAADLAAHRGRCALAYWHIPRFSSGQHGDHSAYRAMWRVLAARGVDLVLAGHDHNYERLGRLDADGRPSQTGIRSFVVGTGGRNLRPVGPPRAGSELRLGSAFGFLELRLREDSFAWRFVGVSGTTLDAGEDQCH